MKKILHLKSQGFYENLRPIAECNSQQDKINARLETLRMNQATGADEGVLEKIEALEKGFAVAVDLVWFM